MKKVSIFLASIVLMLSTEGGAGEFIGDFRLKPNPSDSSGLTRVLHHDFYFKDDADFVWKANAGNVTDGASIPAELQLLIGRPFDEGFVRAAVIHDHYCDKERKNRVRNWRSTHRVFYEMLRTSHVPLVKSKVMYYAVYAFGPKWGYLDQGDICGANCINNVRPRYFEKMTYSFDEATVDELQSIVEAVESDPNISLDALDNIAEAYHGNNRSFRFTQHPQASE